MTNDAQPIEIRRVTSDDVRDFAGWRYPAPYDVYDITDEVDDAVSYFTQDDVNCHALTEAGQLVGFCTFGPDARVPGGDYDDPAIDIGLGVRPTLVGRGHGSRYVDAVVAHATSEFGTETLRVTIASGNSRARRVWEAAGFSTVADFRSPQEVLGTDRFVVLVSE